MASIVTWISSKTVITDIKTRNWDIETWNVIQMMRSKVGLACLKQHGCSSADSRLHVRYFAANRRSPLLHWRLRLNVQQPTQSTDDDASLSLLLQLLL